MAEQETDGTIRAEFESHALHIVRDNTSQTWHAWLNTDIGDFDGLIIGIGNSRADSIQHAFETVNLALAELREMAEQVGLELKEPDGIV